MRSGTYLRQLLALRARLRGEVQQMANAALTESGSTRMPIHMAELGSDNFDRELSLQLLGSEQDALDLIDAAIARLADGSYGRCIACGAAIPKSRLDAIPYAAHCVRCASELEATSSKASIPSRRRILPR